MPTLRDARFCPICATPLQAQVLEGRERMACSACGFILYLNPTPAAGVLIEDQEGRVVLIRRGAPPRQGYWALPSGFAEVGETIEETAIREAREETGLDIELDHLLGVYSYLRDPVVLVLYTGHVVGGELRAGEDALDARLFAPGDLPPGDDIAYQTHRDVLEDWLRARAIAVRPATAEEVQAIAGMEVEYEFSPGTDYAVYADGEDRRLFVAVDRGQAVGFAAVAYFRWNQAADLARIFVLPSYRRWGIATRLIEQSAAFAAARRARALTATVPAGNPAVVVYLKAGFRIAGFDEFRYPAGRPDGAMALLLAKVL